MQCWYHIPPQRLLEKVDGRHLSLEDSVLGGGGRTAQETLVKEQLRIAAMLWCPQKTGTWRRAAIRI